MPGDHAEQDGPGAAGLFTHLADLLPVLRELNRATKLLAAALPGEGGPDPEAPSLDAALAEVNAAIDDYCAVSLAHSGLLSADA